MKGYNPLPQPENASPLNLPQIIGMEPRIAGILDALKPSRRNHKWFSQYSDAKSELSKLVGWDAEQIGLRTRYAYDIVMDTVIENLDGKKGDTLYGEQTPAYQRAV